MLPPLSIPSFTRFSTKLFGPRSYVYWNADGSDSNSMLTLILYVILFFLTSVLCFPTCNFYFLCDIINEKTCIKMLQKKKTTNHRCNVQVCYDKKEWDRRQEKIRSLKLHPVDKPFKMDDRLNINGRNVFAVYLFFERLRVSLLCLIICSNFFPRLPRECANVNITLITINVIENMHYIFIVYPKCRLLQLSIFLLTQ